MVKLQLSSSVFTGWVVRLRGDGHFLPRWLRMGWRSVINRGKIPWNTLPWPGIEHGPQGGQTMSYRDPGSEKGRQRDTFIFLLSDAINRRISLLHYCMQLIMITILLSTLDVACKIKHMLILPIWEVQLWIISALQGPDLAFMMQLIGNVP